MLVCPSCGHANGESAKFCEECGTALAATSASREQRKTVTVLFCDVTGSTALGESTDPEALRALLARYFERMQAIVERHGGTVEKFIGDAVMAVFGVPRVHEDDALRAARAALEMRDALPELGLQARIGVNTGEVVTGTEERLATGDAVNVAARLEQAAQPGEVLIGEATLALVRDAVDVEGIDPLALKGKAEPVPACRLLSGRAALERRHESPFVGRERELACLRKAWERVRGEARCELVTVIGDPGIGKSRLAGEFLHELGARVVQGRCLPYGERITYWPVVEVVKQLAALPSDPAAQASLRSLLGQSEQGTSTEEIAWAFRKLLEEQAEDVPLVCLFDDIQWGEDTFLDLVEHVALLSSGAPLLLCCLARPELTERHPQWPVALRLEPIPDEDVEALLPQALGRELRERITRAAGGNPLFLTEMAAMAGESEGEELAIPPSLQALLAARLDRLETAERSVLERGAVEGELFHRGSVQALSENRQVTPRLAALVRKQLIRPEKAQLPGEDGFRFRHLLIRDAAYDALPKARRAELHERFSGWLEDRGASLVELDELLGYHLEQATRYKAELGQPDPDLAGRAGERLAAAGRRALWRGDVPAARELLTRALELIRPLRLDVDLELDLASVQRTPRDSTAIADAAAERAAKTDDRRGEAMARLVATVVRAGSESDITQQQALAEQALVLLDADDHPGLVYAWMAFGQLARLRGQYEKWAYAADKAVQYSRLAGRPVSFLFGLDFALVEGPRPADEALRTLDNVAPRVLHPVVLLKRAVLLAMLRRFDDAWPLARAASKRLRELTTGEDRGEFSLSRIATLAGDHEEAARLLRLLCDYFAEIDSRSALSTFAPNLGRTLCALRRYDEAEPLAQQGRELGADDDVLTQALWRQVKARVLAHRGEHEEAQIVAREAVRRIETTDMLNSQGDAYCDLAEVLQAAGRAEEAAEALEQALERYERKRNLAMVAQVRPRLEALRAGVR